MSVLPDAINIERITSLQTLEECSGLLVDAYNAEPWNDQWTKEKALEKLACFYQSPKFLGLTARTKDRLVGCCVGNVEPYYTGDYFYLKEMFVPAGLQQKGIGTQLMARLKEELKGIDIDTIILFTGKNFFPFDFYLKSGFAEMEDMRMMHLGNAE